MRTLAEYLPEHPFFAGLDPAAMDLVVGCAQNVHFSPGEVLFRTGEPANTFYVIRHGRVALDIHDPRRGTLVIASLGEGEVVGWSWLIPPYQWMFDARAVDTGQRRGPRRRVPARQVRPGPGARLRPDAAGLARDVRAAAGRPDAAARPVRECLVSVDVTAAAAGHELPVDPMLPRPFRVVETRLDTRDTVTLALEPLDGVPLAHRAGQFTMLHAFGVGEVPISICGDPTRPGPLLHTIRDVGAVTHALVTAAPGTTIGVRGPFGTGWDVADGMGQRRRGRDRRDRPGPPAPGDPGGGVAPR